MYLPTDLATTLNVMYKASQARLNRMRQHPAIYSATDLRHQEGITWTLLDLRDGARGTTTAGPFA